MVDGAIATLIDIGRGLDAVQRGQRSLAVPARRALASGAPMKSLMRGHAPLGKLSSTARHVQGPALSTAFHRNSTCALERLTPTP